MAQTSAEMWDDDENWALFTDGMIFHLVPLTDELEHEMSAKCWCCPTVDDDEMDVRVHNAYVVNGTTKAH